MTAQVQEDLRMVAKPSSPDENRVIRAVPAARWLARREGIDLASIRGSGPDGIVLLRDIRQIRSAEMISQPTRAVDKVPVSSLARKMAEKRGVDVISIEGTGNRGRIMLADVAQAAEVSAVEKAGTTQGQSPFGQTVPMTQIRKVIAKRMAQSAFTAPHIFFFSDVEMDKLESLREEIIPDFEKRFQVRISINDFLIKAVALTICEFPMLNAMVKGEDIYVMPEINVGLAVAMAEGLIVPAIPRANQLGLGRIAQMRSDLVERARAGKLKLQEVERGTFTISSLAQFDVVFFTAILNPPQSGILTVGKTREQLALGDNEVIMKKVARLGLSVDHRIIDGAVAGAFLQSLKSRLENPTFAFMHL